MTNTELDRKVAVFCIEQAQEQNCKDFFARTSLQRAKDHLDEADWSAIHEPHREEKISILLRDSANSARISYSHGKGF